LISRRNQIDTLYFLKPFTIWTAGDREAALEKLEKGRGRGRFSPLKLLQQGK